MNKDLWRYSFIISCAAFIGYAFYSDLVYALVFSLLATVVILLWQTIRINLLYKWIINPSNEPLPSNDGQFFLLHRELSRRNSTNKIQKKLLTEQLGQFRKAASVIPDAIVLIDLTGKITWANQKASHILGIQWPRDADVRFSDLIRDPELNEIFLENDSTDGIEILSPVNRELTLNVKCLFYTTNQKMIIARDVSRLLSINKIHTDFVANVSHELKTPLTVLKGYLEILNNSKIEDERFEKPINQMVIETERMRLIVEDLLYLSKLEDKHSNIEMTPVAVSQVVMDIMETLDPMITSKGLQVELNIDQELKIQGKESELHSAFLNLITNAVKYTPIKGQININWTSNEQAAFLSVQDNGDGVPASEISKLTNRFFRVDNDRSRESGGTGLGLAIVKHVLQRHNAKLNISSSVGLGSTFECEFPLISNAGVN